jgi:hypothetical protein
MVKLRELYHSLWLQFVTHPWCRVVPALLYLPESLHAVLNSSPLLLWDFEMERLHVWIFVVESNSCTLTFHWVAIFWFDCLYFVLPTRFQYCSIYGFHNPFDCLVVIIVFAMMLQCYSVLLTAMWRSAPPHLLCTLCSWELSSKFPSRILSLLCLYPLWSIQLNYTGLSTCCQNSPSCPWLMSIIECGGLHRQNGHQQGWMIPASLHWTSLCGVHPSPVQSSPRNWWTGI